MSNKMIAGSVLSLRKVAESPCSSQVVLSDNGNYWPQCCLTILMFHSDKRSSILLGILRTLYPQGFQLHVSPLF